MQLHLTQAIGFCIPTHRNALNAASQVKVSTFDASMLSTTMLMATTNTSHWFQPLQSR